jgi:hypothetical protein
MQKTTKTLLVVASLLTVSATAMAATSHKVHRDARAAATISDYDAQATFVQPGVSLFDRAKGNID